MTHTEIISQIKNKDLIIGRVASSTYSIINKDVLLRVSNHLPNVANFDEYNEGVNKIMMIFEEGSVSEKDVESFIENKMEADYSVNFYILTGDNDGDIYFIKHLISRL